MDDKTEEQRLAQQDIPISRKQAAKLLGVCLDTLDSWTIRFGIPHVKYDLPDNPGNKGKVVYFVRDLISFRDSFHVKKQPGEDASRSPELKGAG